MADRGDNPTHKLDEERRRVKESALSERDIDAVLRFLDAFDENEFTESFTNEHGNKETLSYGSLEAYSRAMRLIGKEIDGDLLDQSLDDLAVVFSDFLDDLSIETVRQRQAAAIKFYRFHETGIDPDEIPLKRREQEQTVDEQDMFTSEEVDALREACDNTRDRCLLELLLYTGQRIRAIQTLRLKDIDIEEGVYYLNTDELGLKGADKVGKKRPLLGAENAVREWMNNHPTGNSEDYLVSALPSATNTTSNKGDYLSAPAIRARLEKIGMRAEVNKPVNPHNFRHYFVTVCIREYDMDPSTVKFLIGHAEDSTVMETTYQHLSDEDHINAARRASGAGREPKERESALTPDTCPVCNEPQSSNAKACPKCGEVFTPDARAAREQVSESINVSKGIARERDNEKDDEAMDKLKHLISENPELLDELSDEM